MTKKEQLNDLFSRWKEKHSVQVFMKDGIVCEENYEGLLFILKDVNNAKKDEINDICESVKISSNEGKTWANVARWTKALLDGESYNECLQYIDSNHNGDLHTFQHEQLKRTAIINLKKEAGGSSVSDDVINRFAEAHKEMILEEIEICDPKLIVVCGVNIFEGAKSVLGEVTALKGERPSLEMASEWEIGTVELKGKQIPIIQFRHPSRCFGVQKPYEDLVKIREFIFGK